ncbi:hypothetical protein, partial [Streptomyces sp. NPDC057686]|uniref:hypothetical protein n=1 Tax=Streptomyces sp. NPDC057686 TaxID=3346212 RepID=UPI0036B80C2E
ATNAKPNTSSPSPASPAPSSASEGWPNEMTSKEGDGIVTFGGEADARPITFLVDPQWRIQPLKLA